MKHRFLGSVVAAALMSTTVMAEGTMLQRFEAMEKEMNALKAELAAMKAQSTAPSTAKKVSLKDDDEDDKPVKATSGKIKIAVEDDEDDKKPAKASSGKIKIAVEKDDDHKTIPEQLEDIHDQLSTLNKRTNGNAIKWDVDLRTSVDNINYKMADGSKQKNDALFTNRLWLGMNYAATKNLSFTGQLAYNKIFGQRGVPAQAGSDAMDGFDWVSGESAYDDTLRVRSAYFYYQDDEFLGADIPWTISVGRRPSTVGHLINLREGDTASSPLAHTVNVEFDGASAKFGMEELTGLTGSYFKLCAGRGMSSAEPRFTSAPYSDQNIKTNNIDMAGIILIPYDDKQYSLGMQYTYANNLIDITTPAFDNTGTFLAPNVYDPSMKTVGGLHTATAFAMVNGIGEGWSEFLDDSLIFVSGAMSKTDPYKGADANTMSGQREMLGSAKSETGYSYWIGTQFPSLISDEGRWGAEFNHGSNYWRPITYGEDTLIGSKIAARGDAYELYFTEPLVKDILTFQLRYTYIDYDYTGSNGFFGSSTGTPMAISDVPNGTDMGANAVSRAQDIRAYIRYKF